MTTEIADLHLLEKQPPCLKLTVFDGYWASWHEPCELREAHRVARGRIDSVRGVHHGGAYFSIWSGDDECVVLFPDTAEEAARLYAEACEWLRERSAE